MTCPDNPSGQRKRNPLLLREEVGGFQRNRFSFQLPPMLVVPVYYAVMQLTDMERTFKYSSRHLKVTLAENLE